MIANKVASLHLEFWWNPNPQAKTETKDGNTKKDDDDNLVNFTLIQACVTCIQNCRMHS